jgi:Flp pilus assembly protein TadG
MRDLKKWRGRQVRHPLIRDDRGAIGVLIAVLIAGGVLLGIGALAVDVGQLYSERAQLQNGADAGALAVAKTCAQGSCSAAAAQFYANRNSADGTSAVNLVCGSGTLGACPATTGKMYDCPPPPVGATNYVDVHTSTLTPSGSTLLPPTFARTLLGMSSYKGSTVRACAQASWGPPKTGNTIAFTISACTWDKATSQGFAPPPPYPPNPAQSFDQVIRLHGSPGNTNPQGCPTEPAGADGPGNFGWTDDSGNCNVQISGGTYGGNTGTSVSKDCAQALYNYWLSKTVVFVPVYVSISGPGSGSTYTLKGFAAFVVTGFNLPGSTVCSPKPGLCSDWLKPSNNCKGDNFCINGFFTQALVPGDGSIGGTNLGADIIALTG